VSIRNIIQTTFDDFAKESGFSKKSGSRYLRNDETLVVLNLQKSQYGLQYYVNIGLWLLALRAAEYPKEHHCPIRTRLTRLVPTATEARLALLLDLEALFDEGARSKEFLDLLERACCRCWRRVRRWKGFARVTASC